MEHESLVRDLPERRAVTVLPGVGPRQAERLARLGVHTLGDLWFHLPLRYQDRTRVWPLAALRPGQEVLVCGTVLSARVVPGRRRTLVVRLQDASGGVLGLRFFHFGAAQLRQFAEGVVLSAFGEVRPGIQGLEMVHPEYHLGEAQPQAGLTPVYPTTEGLGQARLRRWVGAALELAEEGCLGEWLPPSWCRDAGLPSLRDALFTVHRPPPEALEAILAGEHPAQRRLALEELLAHHLGLRRARQCHRRRRAPRVDSSETALAPLLDRLPFHLTGAQRRVLREVAADLARAEPMLRLVQGDVGSGKTVIAAAAAWWLARSGWQTALMAPTELLAEQHAANLAGWLAPLGVEVVLLNGRQRAAERRQVLEAISEGRAGVAVGTHALFQESVRFARLGLVIVDEQHRFGVHQRLALREKGVVGDRAPHQLVMTATPIPRTLAMTAYGDLDVSSIDELPPGRTPVETVVIPERRRDEVVARVRAACGAGRQAYWVCPLVDESEQLACQAAEETAVRLREELAELRVGLVHGRMKGEEKAAVMTAFKAGEIDLLVATTVIEVGVDVPNATVMIIDNAERLGLAQLHQLRGRVGRGRGRSVCVLLYHGRLSATARARLAVLRESNDGFVIAERDLALRGPGEVLGTRQTGLVGLRVADLERDAVLIPLACEWAERLLQHHPEAVEPLLRRWLSKEERYAEV